MIQALADYPHDKISKKTLPGIFIKDSLDKIYNDKRFELDISDKDFDIIYRCILTNLSKRRKGFWEFEPLYLLLGQAHESQNEDVIDAWSDLVKYLVIAIKENKYKLGWNSYGDHIIFDRRGYIESCTNNTKYRPVWYDINEANQGLYDFKNGVIGDNVIKKLFRSLAKKIGVGIIRIDFGVRPDGTINFVGKLRLTPRIMKIIEEARASDE